MVTKYSLFYFKEILDDEETNNNIRTVDKICNNLKEKSKIPDIPDYGLATYRPNPITNYGIKLKNYLDYGYSGNR